MNFHDPWVGTDTPGSGEAAFATSGSMENIMLNQKIRNEMFEKTWKNDPVFPFERMIFPVQHLSARRGLIGRMRSDPPLSKKHTYFRVLGRICVHILL